VLPNIAGEEWDIFGGKGSLGIGSGEDIERTVGLFYEPNPSRSKGFQRKFGKIFLKIR